MPARGSSFTGTGRTLWRLSSLREVDFNDRLPGRDPFSPERD